MSSSGQLQIPFSTPALTSLGQVAAGATLSVFNTGTSVLANLYSNSALSVPIVNPLTANSAGRFTTQTTVIWASDAQSYDAVLTFPDGSNLSFSNLNVLELQQSLSAYATINSPAFTGVPTAPTPATNDNSNKIATTGYVQNQAFAPLNSPTFSGVPLAPTPATADNTTKIATTAYVQANKAILGWSLNTSGYTALSNGLWLVWGQFTITIASAGTVSFPVTFPTNCFSCVITPGGSNNPTSIFYISSVSTAGFAWTYASSGGPASYTAYYMAIGN